MTWDYEQCADYVKRNAPAGSRPLLLMPAVRAYSSKLPNISISYYSMPDWLAIFELGPRHVGQRRFESVAHEYKFVAKKYHDKVVALLDRVAKSGSGAALLQEVVAVGGRSLRIMPHLHWKRVNLPGPRNASPRPVRAGERLADVVNGTFPNTAAAHARGAPILDDDANPTGERGTGTGSDVVLFYSPEDWEGRKSGTDDFPGAEPDETLFHELVHVTRQLRGLQTGRRVDGDFGNEEEYLATMIANLYLSEKGKPLRGVYDETLADQSVRRVQANGKTILWVIGPPPKGWAVMRDPDNWYRTSGKANMSPPELIQRFGDKQKSFYLALSRLPDGKPRFNPVKEHAASLAYGLTLAHRQQAIRQGTR